MIENNQNPIDDFSAEEASIKTQLNNLWTQLKDNTSEKRRIRFAIGCEIKNAADLFKYKSDFNLSDWVAANTKFKKQRAREYVLIYEHKKALEGSRYQGCTFYKMLAIAKLVINNYNGGDDLYLQAEAAGEIVFSWEKQEDLKPLKMKKKSSKSKTIEAIEGISTEADENEDDNSALSCEVEGGDNPASSASCEEFLSVKSNTKEGVSLEADPLDTALTTSNYKPNTEIISNKLFVDGFELITISDKLSPELVSLLLQKVEDALSGTYLDLQDEIDLINNAVEKTA